jgi:hypothetical protein
MDPFSALAFGGKALDFITGIGDRKRQTALQQAALNLERQQALENHRLALADRTDAYGNRTYFDGAGFRTQLSPLQQAIADAQQREDVMRLTQDAPRERAAGVRADQRGQATDTEYNDVMAEFRDRRVPTAAEGASDETLAALADRERMTSSPELSRVAVRSMQTGGPLQRAFQQLSSNQPSIERTLLESRRRGEEAAMKSRATSSSALLGEAGQLAQLASQGIGAKDVARIGSGDAGSALQTALQALSGNNSGASNVLMNASRTTGGSGGAGALAAALATLLGANQEEETAGTSLAPRTSPRPPMRPW